MRREGIEPKRTLIRGGTDGSRLTEMGLPTPNLFTGGRDYHSEREWLCDQEMGAACATIVHLVRLWAEADACRYARSVEPLLDGWGSALKSVRVSVTDKCNFRCRYCMPAEG